MTSSSPQLATEIREFIVDCVNTHGGHLGSNLGAVEITLALHRVFRSPHDIILWDTGHQAYVHKLVTGRRDDFATLRQEGGLSGLPEPGRVRPRLGREQPRVDRRVVRPRPRHRAAPARRGRPPDRRRDRRRRADRRHGVRGAQQPRPLRPQGHHHPQRQRPVLRSDGVQPVREPVEAPLVERLPPPERPHRAHHLGAAPRRLPRDVASTAPRPPSARCSSRRRSSSSSASGTSARTTATTSRASKRRSATPHEVDGPVVVHCLTQKGRGYAPAENDPIKNMHDMCELKAGSYTAAFSEAIVAEGEARSRARRHHRGHARLDRPAALRGALPGPHVRRRASPSSTPSPRPPAWPWAVCARSSRSTRRSSPGRSTR